MNSNCQSPREKSPSQSVCVLGLGLIGGSLLRRLTACGYPAFGWNRSTATVEQAAADGMDVSGDLPATLQRAAREDALLVVAVPLLPLLFGPLTGLSFLQEPSPTTSRRDIRMTVSFLIETIWF